MDERSRLEALSDAALLRRSRSSPAAFRVLYDRHAERINAFLRRRTGDPASAFELTAETFAQAWLSRDRFTDPGNGDIGPWLFGIARNTVAASVRRRAIERQGRDRLGFGIDAEALVAPVDPAWLDGLDEDLAAAVAGLPDCQRVAVELRVIDDQGYDQVARALGCSEGAARVRVHRGLAELRRRLTQSAEG